MNISDEIIEKDLTLAELGLYARLLYHCQKSDDNTWHGGYDDVKSDLLKGRSEREVGMEALSELHGRGLIQVKRTEGIWHIKLVEVKE